MGWYQYTGGSAGTRTFEQILEDEKRDRNILEIQLQKCSVDCDDQVTTIKSLSYEDLGELLFDVLEIKPEECIAFNFSTGRYDLRELKFLPNVNLSSYTRVTPFEFKGHLVTVRQQRRNVTKVTFKNVPLNVPNEEILNLCRCYGKPVDNVVHFETLRNIRGFNLSGSTRYVEMQLDEGKSFQNFYWMEGPLPGDMGKRIVVLHSGQTTQCSHCLQKAGSGCPAMGIGKVCQKTGTPRAKMNTYMQSLRSHVGYASLKIKYIENQAKMFPSLIGLPGEKSSEDEVDGVWSMKEDDSSILLNPIEQKDKTIFEQKKQIESLNKYQDKANSLELELEMAKAENVKICKKLNFTRKATEQRIFENITNKEFYRDDPLLVSVLSATLNEDEVDIESDEIGKESEHLSRREHFLLESLDSKIDKNDETQRDRLTYVKMQVLEKLKTTKLRRSVSNKRRQSDVGFDDSVRSTSRPRTTSPSS